MASRTNSYAPHPKTPAASRMPGTARFHGKRNGSGRAGLFLDALHDGGEEAGRGDELLLGGENVVDRGKFDGTGSVAFVSICELLIPVRFISRLLFGIKCRKFEIAAFSTKMRKPSSQQFAGARQTSLHGSLRQAHGAGGGAQIHLMKVEENYRLAIAVGQGEHRAANFILARLLSAVR